MSSKPRGALRLVLADQLTRSVSSLQGADAERDTILMAEVDSEATYVRHHKKKIAFLFAAMRKFAAALKEDGFCVRYVRIGDAQNTHDLGSEVARAFKEGAFDRVIATRCGEWRLDQAMRGWADQLGAPVEIREDDRFICDLAEFRRWSQGKSQLRMEFFYRRMRAKTGLLMEGDQPAGGLWNYDSDNRGKPAAGTQPPAERFAKPDAITQGAIAEVEARFGDHFGDLEPWTFATDAAGAEEHFKRFLEEALPSFGRYQDAMLTGAPFMWHALISMYLNAGLLDPLDICRRAEVEWRKQRAPLNSVEGFVRQILGWREYVRGIYWQFMPEYSERNALNAAGSLPGFYWTAETDMVCMREAVEATKRYAYAHHIQRLMVTGNFALLAGISPSAINEWYLAVYADAYEWVELPNTHGMAIYADGGTMASKPYAASGAYINRMSDYCKGCRYDPKRSVGAGACPFTTLYWDFLMRHERTLKRNPRMGLVLKSLDRKTAAERRSIAAQAHAYLADFGVTPSNAAQS